MSSMSGSGFVPFSGTGYNLNGEASLPTYTIGYERTCELMEPYLGPTKQLVHTEALKILKQIRWKSEVKAFLTHPIFVGVVALAGLIASTFIPLTHIALTIVHLVLRILCAGILGGIIGACIGGGYRVLKSTSEEYASDASLARSQIERLEKQGACTVILNSGEL